MRYYDSDSGSEADDHTSQFRQPPSKNKYYLESETPENTDFVILGGHEPVKIHVKPPGPEDEPTLGPWVVESDFFAPKLSLTRTLKSRRMRPSLCFMGYVTRTLKTMKAEYESYRQAWLSSSGPNDVKQLIEDMREGKTPITNVVCCCLGSLQGPVERLRMRSHTQLAVLMFLIGTLDVPQTAPLLAQDPHFTHLDKEFLTTLGLTPVDDPQGFAAVNAHTLYFSIAGYHEVTLSVAQVAFPAAIICNACDEASYEAWKVECEEGRPDTEFEWLRKHESALIGRMVEDCEARRWPVEGEDDPMAKIWMYWRREV